MNLTGFDLRVLLGTIGGFSQMCPVRPPGAEEERWMGVWDDTGLLCGVTVPDVPI